NEKSFTAEGAERRQSEDDLLLPTQSSLCALRALCGEIILLLQHFELDVLEPDVGRAAAVDLQADHAAAGEHRVLVAAHQVAVDPDLHVRALRLDRVVVPLVRLDELLAALLDQEPAAAL